MYIHLEERKINAFAILFMIVTSPLLCCERRGDWQGSYKNYLVQYMLLTMSWRQYFILNGCTLSLLTQFNLVLTRANVRESWPPFVKTDNFRLCHHPVVVSLSSYGVNTVWYFFVDITKVRIIYTFSYWTEYPLQKAWAVTAYLN